MISRTGPAISKLVYEVSIKLGVKDDEEEEEEAAVYTMQFGECNVSGQGTDNLGQSIRLVEALDLE